MNSFLLTLAALLILALSAAFAIPHFVDWNAYRGVFEAQAERLLGREVRVGGDVRLTVLPVPVLRFEDVRIADSDGGFETPLAAADSFTVRLSVPPLLSGIVEAREVTLERPALNLRVDGDQDGNWAGVGPDVQAPALMPSGVTLEQVVLNDARITLTRGSQGEPIALDGLNATLSARSLNGPYRFNGAFHLQGVERELRFTTGRREADGSMRLRLVTRDVAGTDSYDFDGAVAGLGGMPRFKGALHARYAPAGGRLSEDYKPGIEPDHGAAAEVKAEIDAGLTDAAFDEIEIALRNNDRPQTVTGRMRADWSADLSLDGALAARWLDLDALVGDGAAGPILPHSLLMLAREIMPHLAGAGDSRLQVALEQAVLGGDVVNDLRIDAAGDGEALSLRRLEGRLPGDNDVVLAGTIRPVDGEPVFQGRAEIEGRRLSRLLRWMGAESTAFGALADGGAYSVQTQVTAAAGRLEFENARGTVLGSAFTGGLAYRSGPRPSLSLAFDSERLDLDRLLGERISAGALAALLAPGTEAEGDARSPGWFGGAEAAVDMRIGAVTLPRLGEAELVAKFRFADDTLDVESMRLEAGRGLVLRGAGRLANIGARPDGRIDMEIAADSADALEALARFAEIPSSLAPSRRLQALSPLAVRASLRSFPEGERGLQTQVAGTAGGSDVDVTLGLVGDLREMGQGRLEFAANLRNADGKALLTQLLPRLPESGLAPLDDSEGRLTVTATGVAAQELAAEARFDAAGLQASFDGTGTFDGTDLSLAGATAFSVPRAATALTLIGVPAAGAPVDGPLDVRGQLSKAGGVYALTKLNGRVGDQDVEGTARIDATGAKPRFDIALRTGEVSLATLLAPTVAWDATAEADAVIGVGLRGVSFWPDRHFDVTALDSIEGIASLAVERMYLDGPLAIDDVVMHARLEGGALTIEDLRGGLFGGALSASATLARRGNGVGFTGELKAQGLRLDRLTANSGGGSLAEGQADLELSVAGEGLTPGGLVSGLTGEGRLSLGGGTIYGLAPRALATLAERAEASTDEPPAGEALATRVAARLESEDFGYAPLAVGFTVRNGTARFEKSSLTGESGDAVVSSYLDLVNLRLDSEWMLSPGGAKAGTPAPQVALLFAGSLRDFGRIKPEIDAQALERYITMRRMERDVELLEELDVRGPGIPRDDDGDAPPAGPERTEEPPQATLVAPLDTAAPRLPRPGSEQPSVSADPEPAGAQAAAAVGRGPAAPPAQRIAPPVPEAPPTPLHAPAETPAEAPAEARLTIPDPAEHPDSPDAEALPDAGTGEETTLPWLKEDGEDAGDLSSDTELEADAVGEPPVTRAPPRRNRPAPRRTAPSWQTEIWQRHAN